MADFIKLTLPDIENCLSWAGEPDESNPFSNSEKWTIEKLKTIESQMKLKRELNKLKGTRVETNANLSS